MPNDGRCVTVGHCLAAVAHGGNPLGASLSMKGEDRAADAYALPPLGVSLSMKGEDRAGSPMPNAQCPMPNAH
jgi:hypothetical protein